MEGRREAMEAQGSPAEWGGTSPGRAVSVCEWGRWNGRLKPAYLETAFRSLSLTLEGRGGYQGL